MNTITHSIVYIYYIHTYSNVLIYNVLVLYANLAIDVKLIIIYLYILTEYRWLGRAMSNWREPCFSDILNLRMYGKGGVYSRP